VVIAVADGMGGHVGGEIASSRALGPIGEIDRASHPSAEAASEALGEAIAEANRLVLDHGEANPELSGMGTTLTAAMIREGRLHVAHVGDSRAYLLRDGELTQLTSDHTLVEQMVRNGQISRAEAAVHPHRSVLTRAIGVDRTIEVDTLAPVPLQPGDQVLLCSDGLTGPLNETDLAHLLAEHDDGDGAVQALIDAANDAGGPDNITVVLLRADAAHGESVPAAPPAGSNATTRLDAAGKDSADPPSKPRAISTAPPVEADSRDWARQFSRYGQPQGAEGGGEPGTFRPATRRRLTRLVAGILAAVLLLGLLAGGGYALLTRAYFVGQADDEIVVFQGIPQTVLGMDLFWSVEETGLNPEGLPEHMQNRLEEGLMATSLPEARQIVDRYERAIEEAEPDEDDGDGGADEAGDADEAEGSP
jgi:protein phosphatase